MNACHRWKCVAIANRKRKYHIRLCCQARQSTLMCGLLKCAATSQAGISSFVIPSEVEESLILKISDS